MKLYKPLISPRVDAIVLSIEFFGGVISIFIGFFGFFGFWFIDFCAGGILAMPVAVLIGFTVSRNDDGSDTGISLRSLAAFLFALSLNIFLLTIVILPMIHGKITTDRIRNLEEGSIKKIIVRNEYGEDIIGVIGEEEVLNQFVQLSKDISTNSSINMSKAREDRWQLKLVLAEGSPIRMTWEHREDRPHRVYGHFMDGESDSGWYEGSYSSSGLRQWFSDHVAEHLPDE